MSLRSQGPFTPPGGFTPSGTPAIGDVLVSSAASQGRWARLPAATAGLVLTAQGAGAAPAYASVNPANMVIASQTAGDLLVASSSTAWARCAAVAVGSVLVSGGVGAAPVWDNDPTLITSGGGATVVPGLTVKNATAAALGAQQCSPSFKMVGYGYATSLSASREVSGEAYILPVQSANNPLAWYCIRTTNPDNVVDVARFYQSNAYFPYAIYAVSANFATAYAVLGYDGNYNFVKGLTSLPFVVGGALAVGTAGDAIRFWATAGRRTAGNILSWGDDNTGYSEQGYVRGVDGAFCISPTARTTGTPQTFVVTGAAHTGITAGAEASLVHFNMAATRTWAAGALATQRFFRIDAPTIAFASASTCALASTVYISGPPIAGANCTLTQGHPIHVDSGEIRLDSAIAIDAGEDQAELGKTPTAFNKVMNEWLIIHTQNGRRAIPCFAPDA